MSTTKNSHGAGKRDRVLSHMMAARKRFGRYKDEEKKVVRVPEVSENTAIYHLRNAWLSLSFDSFWTVRQGLNTALAKLRGISYTPKNVEQFSLALVEFQEKENFEWKAGYFLSALVNKCREKDFTIFTKQIGGEIGLLGIKNTKNITIEGNTSIFLGYGMVQGRIVLMGDAGILAGDQMKGGEIVILGNVGYQLGWGMQGGKITVKKNCEKIEGMVGGEIHVEGEIGSIGNIIHGKIYHKGKLIVDK